MKIAHGFVDGRHLLQVGKEVEVARPDPHLLVSGFCRMANLELNRLTYYDGLPEDQSEIEKYRKYWETIETLPNTHLGWGLVRGRPRRQKAVDTLIAVDMLVGAFHRLFSVAIIVTGDADFIPVVHEVQRQGVNVIVAAGSGFSQELRRAADHFLRLEHYKGGSFKELTIDHRSILTGDAAP